MSGNGAVPEPFYVLDEFVCEAILEEPVARLLVEKERLKHLAPKSDSSGPLPFTAEQTREQPNKPPTES